MRPASSVPSKPVTSLKVIKGLVKLARIAQDLAKVAGGLGIVGLKFEGLAVSGRSLIHFILATKDSPQVEVSVCIVSLEFDCLAVGGRGLIEFLLVIKSNP